MASTKFDTQAAVSVLRNSGLDEGPAIAIVNTVRDAQSASLDEAATRVDLEASVAVVRTDLEASVAVVRTDLEASVAVVRADLEASVAVVRADLEASVAGLRADFFRALWIQGAGLVATQIAIAGFIVTLVKVL